MQPDFIKRHGLWTAEQTKLADELRKRVEKDRIRLIRLAWADPHGCIRSKTLTVPAFMDALSRGYNINVATHMLDGAGGRVFASFTRGGGVGLDEMTGSPNLTIVPDPETFRLLPWEPGIAWILCDEYFPDGKPFHFSTRRLLREQVRRLEERGMEPIIGLEVEWYLFRVADDRLGAENIGTPGMRGRPVETAPLEPGYSYHSESNLDLMQPVLNELAKTYEELGLPLRSFENEYGPSQLECTFAALPALRAADDYALFRSATRQVCRRMGYFATFMCKPAFEGFFSSGWHLHQSIADKASGQNLFTPREDGDLLSTLGSSYLAGILDNTIAGLAFSTPTVNGYRRFRPNSLAPDRVTWGHDHRGTLVRVLGGPGDPDTRLENRVGEPAANPYLFIAAQIAAGLDGMDRKLAPGPTDDTPYDADRPKLPDSLEKALDALENGPLFRSAFGDVFTRYFVTLKRAECQRFSQFLEQAAGEPDQVTQWEQNEYFDFF